MYNKLINSYAGSFCLKSLILLFLISCSKKEETILPEANPAPALSYNLTINQATGGSVNFNNPNEGEFTAGTEIQLSVTTHQDSLFIGWSNGSRSNPLNLLIQSDTILTPRFINKYDLLNRFEKIVIGNGENGPLYTLKWAAMRVYLEGSNLGEFNHLLNDFIRELNQLINHDDDFNIQQVNLLSDANVHLWVTQGTDFKNQYSQFADIDLDSYLGYALWYNNNEGNIFEGIVFANSARMSDTETIEWTIHHELGHILGLKHTDERNSIMHPYFNRGVNNIFSDLDREALRFLHDERIPVFSNWESANRILENILGLPANNRLNQNKKRPSIPIITPTKNTASCYRIGRKQ